MTVRRCGNCDHPIYRHAPDDEELCSIKGCRCPGFLTRRGPTFMDVAYRMVRFAHHEHPFGDEHCTVANCSVAGWLVEYARLAEAER